MSDRFQAPDVIKLKCTAKIGNAYWESVVETTVLKKHGRMLESRSNRAVSGTSIAPTVVDENWSYDCANQFTMILTLKLTSYLYWSGK